MLLDNGRVAAAGTHEELLATNKRYGEVLAAWFDADAAELEAVATRRSTPRSHRRAGPVAMWAASAVSDEDRLDRAETSRVLRRSVEFAQPYRRRIYAALGFVVVSTLCTVAGPLIVRFATDKGLSRGSVTALNIAIVAYCVIVVVNYFVGRQMYMAINQAGEGFLRDLRVASSTDCRRSRWRSSTATRPVCSCPA